MINFNLKFDEIFEITTIALRINRSHPSIPRNIQWMLQFLLMQSVIFPCFIFLLYSILFHDIKAGKFSEASKNATMVIVALTVTLKYLILLYHQDSFKDLINVVNKDYETAMNSSDEDKNIVLQYAKRGITVSKFWLIFGLGSSAIFPIKAFASMGYYYWKGEFKLVAMFDFTYPEPIESHKNEILFFWTLFLLCLLFGAYAASMYLGFDPLVPIFMLHTCGQLDLLSQRMDKIMVEADSRNTIEDNLKKIISKLQELYKLVDRVKTNFSVLYEYNMKSTSFLLPLIAFQIVEDLRDNRINVEFISLFVASILHFFIPCYYSDLLMETSEKFRLAIYSCGWEKCPDKRIRQIVLFMITRARIPMGISTVFYVINLDTFAEMCRQSYGLFNLMNAAWA